MTEHVLSIELTSLIQESRRKYQEVKNAAEKSHQYLKGLPNTSESQLVADLSRKPEFASPFLQACETRNIKLVTSGIAALQRLVVVKALPSDKIGDVLQAFKNCSNLGQEIQLKILQVLAPLSQNYSSDLKGDLLSSALQISSELQSAKSLALSSIAAAALQQLITAVFDKVVVEDETPQKYPVVSDIPGDDGPIQVRAAAYDAFRVFHDLCLLADGENAQLTRLSSISQNSVLELLESILANYREVFSTHRELTRILRTRLMQIIVRCLPGKINFATTVRIVRVLHVLLKEHISALQSECEIVLGLLNHMLDPEAAPLWKRAICLEEFRLLFTDAPLVLDIYGLFDENNSKKSILKDTLASFVKVATEKPSLIGLGQQSTNTSSVQRDTPAEQAALEAGAVVGVVGGSDLSTNIGISVHGSLIKTALMDQYDKIEAPPIPDTYIYGLVLNCLNNWSESMAKFVLPLTVHSDGRSKKKSRVQEVAEQESDINSSEVSDQDEPKSRSQRSQSFRKRTVPIDPTALEKHSSYSRIKILVAFVTDCWPALLATCSTFLNATLDVDFYRALVRTVQKITQVAGLLRLATPRDALLTTLGKAAVPSNIRTLNVSSTKAQPAESLGLFGNARGLLSVDSLVGQASPLTGEKGRRSSLEHRPIFLSSRNLLCLRALINVAIALGPTLESAWSIIFETLQHGDALIALYSNKSSGRTQTQLRTEAEQGNQNMGNEIAAVQAAEKRLLESTADYPNDAFIQVSNSLYGLLHSRKATTLSEASSPVATPSLSHSRKISNIGFSGYNSLDSQDQIFILKQITEMMTHNVSRFVTFNQEDCGWDEFITELTQYASNVAIVSSSRILAVKIICQVAQEAASARIQSESYSPSIIHENILKAFENLITNIYRFHDGNEDEDEYDVMLELHELIMNGLHRVFEHRPEDITEGWDTAFRILSTAFEDNVSSKEQQRSDSDSASSKIKPVVVSSVPRSLDLVKAAFTSIQLICSDFLRSIPNTCINDLFDLLFRFAFQQDDLNMSLTVITFYWEISDLLVAKSETSENKQISGGDPRPNSLTVSDIEATATEGSERSLWLLLLLHLTRLTVDKRQELRNGAVQTLSRIFDNYSDVVPKESWQFCMNVIQFELIESNYEQQRRVRLSERTSSNILSEWNNTSNAILKAVSKFVSAHLTVFLSEQDFNSSWKKLMKLLQDLLQFKSHTLNESVYSSLAAILMKIEDSSEIDSNALDEAYTVWKDNFPHQEEDAKESTENQATYSAYIEAIKQIYRLKEKSIDYTKLATIIDHLQECVQGSVINTYSSDIDNPTVLQKQILDLVSSFRTDLDRIPSAIVKLFARFISLPFRTQQKLDTRGSPTFVALSKISMSSVQVFLSIHKMDQEIYDSGAFTAALQSLSNSVQSKYVWRAQGKKPKLWEKAITCSISILDKNLPVLRTFNTGNETLAAIWEQIVSIAHGIIDADVSEVHDNAVVNEDESFDIQSFKEIRELIIPWLGNTNIPENVRRSFAACLFKNSLMHPNEPGEFSRPDDGPLKELYTIRHGRTQDLVVNPRFRMAQACFAELFDLMSVNDKSAERVKLAQSVAPYMILRAALPLKAYIADQPLRGKLPQPESERQELLLVIRSLKDLDSEKRAIPDTPNIQSDHKKHLHRLMPLFVKAMKVPRQDPDVIEELTEAIEVIGDGFGF